MRVPYIGQPEPAWLTDCVNNQRLTRTEADRLLLWADNYRVQQHADEAEQVFYKTQSGDCTEAILGFGRILRQCHREARLANDRTFYGLAKRRLINEVSQDVQARVMAYLPENTATKEDHHLLQQILDRYGWIRHAVPRDST